MIRNTECTLFRVRHLKIRTCINVIGRHFAQVVVLMSCFIILNLLSITVISTFLSTNVLCQKYILFNDNNIVFKFRAYLVYVSSLTIVSFLIQNAHKLLLKKLK